MSRFLSLKPISIYSGLPILKWIPQCWDVIKCSIYVFNFVHLYLFFKNIIKISCWSKFLCQVVMVRVPLHWRWWHRSVLPIWTSGSSYILVCWDIIKYSTQFLFGTLYEPIVYLKNSTTDFVLLFMDMLSIFGLGFSVFTSIPNISFATVYLRLILRFGMLGCHIIHHFYMTLLSKPLLFFQKIIWRFLVALYWYVKWPWSMIISIECYQTYCRITSFLVWIIRLS